MLRDSMSQAPQREVLGLRLRADSFRPVVAAVLVFVFAYVGSIRLLEHVLWREFRARATAAVAQMDLEVPVADQIQRQLSAAVRESSWVRLGGIRVSLHVFGRDGTLLFLNGVATTPPLPAPNPAAVLRQAERLLPVTAVVDAVSIPIASTLSSALLVVYAALLLQGLLWSGRRRERRHAEALARLQSDRDGAAGRAAHIQHDGRRGRQPSLQEILGARQLETP